MSSKTRTEILSLRADRAQDKSCLVKRIALAIAMGRGLYTPAFLFTFGF
jgi:hypothetical protein